MRTKHSICFGAAIPWLFNLLFLSSLQGSGAEPSPTDWPQWRGPARDGTVPGPTWAASFSSTPPRQLWRIILGPSYSGPITWSISQADTWAHLAVSGHDLFFRELSALVAYRWSSLESVALSHSPTLNP